MSTEKMKFTPGPWMAVEGDTLNPDRPIGIVRYLSKESHEEIDGVGCEYPVRTEVIAEVCCASSGTDKADAALIAAAPELFAALESLLSLCVTEDGLQGNKEEWEEVMYAREVLKKATTVS